MQDLEQQRSSFDAVRQDEALLLRVAPHVTTEALHQAWATVERVLSNALEHPLEDAYRCVRSQSKVWLQAASCFGHDAGSDSRLLFSWLQSVIHGTSIITASDGVERIVLGGSFSLVPAAGAMLPMSALSDPTRRRFLQECEDALERARKLRNTTPAHRQLLLSRGTVAPSKQPLDADACALLIEHVTLESDWQAALGLMETWLPSSTQFKGVVPVAVAAATLDYVTQHCTPTVTDWIRALIGTNTGGGWSSAVGGRRIWIDWVAINEATTARVETPSTNAAAIISSMRERARQREQNNGHENSATARLPQEVLHAATTLIVDIGGIIEQCAHIQQLLTTSSTNPSSNQGDDGLPATTNTKIDRRMNLARRDRIEMRRLLDKFNEDGDIVYLHEEKAAQEHRLAELKRQSGTHTTYL